MTDQPFKLSKDLATRREQRWELANDLKQRGDTYAEAKKMFQLKYPTAPEEMIHAAVFHIYVDGTDAAISWLADTELFLRDPDHKLSSGVTWELLNHVYNWHQLEALFPDGKPGMLELIKDIQDFAEEGALEAIQETAKDLEKMFKGELDHPDFDEP